MEQRLSIITLGVRDHKTSRTFYDSLGWKIANENKDEGIIAYNLPGMCLCLWPAESLADDSGVPFTDFTGFRGFALAYNVREKNDVAKTLNQAENAGAVITKPAHDTFWGGHSGYFSDPDSYLWEVAWNPFSPLDSNGAFQWK